MPIHRRRVYRVRGASHKARMEGLLSLSIFLSTAILLLCLVVCLPDLVSSVRSSLTPQRGSIYFGTAATQDVPVFVAFCEFMMTVSGGYLAVALFIRSGSR